MGMSDHLNCFLRKLYAGQEATVRTRNGTMDWLKIGKRVYFKTVYCHPDYLKYMQSTSCGMLGWMKHKLESRSLGEMSITSDMQMTPPFWVESEEELKRLLMKVKEETEKAGLKIQHLKKKKKTLRS